MSAAAVAAPSPAFDAAALVARLRDTFHSDRTRPIGWRKAQLKRLYALIKENEKALLDALAKDLGRPPFEGWLAEIRCLEIEIEHALKDLHSWMKPERHNAPMVLQPGSAYIQPEPLGVALIIAPWNYPIQLALSPLIGALAAGNCAVVKPSEVSPASSAALAELIPKYLDNDAVVVVEGAVPETTALLEQRWDHIFFTGGERVGKIVMTAAAKHLTPVTLELGGKSPVIIDKTANLKVTARRLIWGKAFNAGQTCIAPDYVLVEDSAKRPLIDALIATLKEFFGDDPKASPDYSRIVSDGHFQRLVKMMDGGTVLHGGTSDPEQRFIELTLLDVDDVAAGVMQEEIFGPVLPIVTVANVDEAIRFVNARPKPLALYMFSSDKAAQQRVLSRTSSGGACINDVVNHFLVPGLPFGGVGTSGMGGYHGKHSFDTFSHRKGVLEKPTFVDPPLRYPPYTDGKKKWTKRLM
jgi:aldehyde dehydrogenase (NAD+)